MTALRARLRRDESGFTLVELLIASSMMLVVLAMSFATVVTVARSSERTRTDHNLNEEARNALNRMSRELREATSLVYAVNAAGASGALTALSFRADFNGDGCAGNTCSGTDEDVNPESITYCFDPLASGMEKTYLWLIPEELTSAPAACSDPADARPLLAGNVGGFTVGYRSNEYRYDSKTVTDKGVVVDDDEADGVTTWFEIDDAGPPKGDVGGSDGNINTTAITSVNSVVLNLTMSAGGRTQNYTTQVDLRNKS